MDEAHGKVKLNVIIKTDDIKKGKFNACTFSEALGCMRLESAVVVPLVKNSALSFKTATNACVNCLIPLNDTSITKSHFDSIISQSKVFSTTWTLTRAIGEVCN